MVALKTNSKIQLKNVMWLRRICDRKLNVVLVKIHCSFICNNKVDSAFTTLSFPFGLAYVFLVKTVKKLEATLFFFFD